MTRPAPPASQRLEGPGSGDLGRYRSVLIDLDGTLWLSRELLPGAGEFVARCRRLGMRVGFVTNGSFERKAWCRDGLARAGIAAEDGAIITAADAVAHQLVADGRAHVAVLGGPGLHEAIERAGLVGERVDGLDARAWHAHRRTRALAVGMRGETTQDEIDRAAALVAAGTPVYASSAHGAMPTKDGPRPGAEVLLGAIGRAVAFEPVVCGKPGDPLGALARRYVAGAGPTLVVGDDLRADVALAARQGWDSLLVLTGASAPGEVGGDLRPTFIEPDLSTALARPRWRRGGEEERAP